MKRKLPLDQEICLPEYFNDTVARSFEKESELRILYWDFKKSIKNKAERRNGYLLPLKCLSCYAEKSGMRDIMKMEQDQEQEYLKRLSIQHISAESYNNKLRVISSFLNYLQVTDCIGEFSNPVPLYYMKSYPIVNEIDNLDQKLDLLTNHLGEFPDNLRIMSLILLTTAIKKGQRFLLKNADFTTKMRIAG